MSETTIDIIPVEILNEIFSFLSASHLLQVGAVNKEFFEVSSTDLLWRGHFSELCELIDLKYKLSNVQRAVSDVRRDKHGVTKTINPTSTIDVSTNERTHLLEFRADKKFKEKFMERLQKHTEFRRKCIRLQTKLLRSNKQGGGNFHLPHIKVHYRIFGFLTLSIFFTLFVLFVSLGATYFQDSLWPKVFALTSFFICALFALIDTCVYLWFLNRVRILENIQFYLSTKFRNSQSTHEAGHENLDMRFVSLFATVILGIAGLFFFTLCVSLRMMTVSKTGRLYTIIPFIVYSFVHFMVSIIALLVSCVGQQGYFMGTLLRVISMCFSNAEAREEYNSEFTLTIVFVFSVGIIFDVLNAVACVMHVFITLQFDYDHFDSGSGSPVAIFIVMAPYWALVVGVIALIVPSVIYIRYFFKILNVLEQIQNEFLSIASGMLLTTLMYIAAAVLGFTVLSIPITISTLMYALFFYYGLPLFFSFIPVIVAVPIFCILAFLMYCLIDREVNNIQGFRVERFEIPSLKGVVKDPDGNKELCLFPLFASRDISSPTIKDNKY